MAKRNGGCLGGCAGRLVLLVLLGVAAYAGFRWGPLVFPPLERWLAERSVPQEPEVGEPSPELADETLDRLDRFRNGQGGSRLVLSGAAVTSVLRYGLPGVLPAGVDEPMVLMEDGRARVDARLARDAFPPLPGLEDVEGLLPDTVPLRLRGRLSPFRAGMAEFDVESLEASRVPIPRRFVPRLLEALGPDGPGEAVGSTIRIRLPAGLESAYIQGDSLILVSNR